MTTRIRTTGTGESLVLLHGGGDDLEALDTLERLLRVAGHAVWVYDRPSHGFSENVPGPFDHEAAAGQLVDVLENHVSAPAHLVGYSDGAIIALLATLRRPDLPRSLTLLSGNLDPAGLTPAVRAEFAATLAAPGDPDALDRRLARLWLTQPQIAPERLHDLPVPSLVVGADADVVRLEHTRAIASALPQGRLHVVADAGHEYPKTRPQDVAGLVTRFVHALA